MKEKRLKIALFIDVYFPMIDGVVVVVDNYAKRLAEFADVTVFCPKPKEKEYDDSAYNYKIERCKSLKIYHYDYPVGLPIFDRKFRKELFSKNFDIVHIHSPFFVSRLGVKYAKSHNIPLVATLHSQYKQDFLTATKSKILSNLLLKNAMKPFNQCTECWAVNERTKEIFTKNYGMSSNCIVQLNATDMLPTDSAQARVDVNKYFNLTDDEKILLYSGRINVLKNILFIADCLKPIKDAGIKFKTIFVGSGQDENLLRKRLEKNGVLDNVILAGRITDRKFLAQIFSRADLHLCPSIYDTSSLVRIEAASQHTPTVFIENTAAASTAIDGVSGIIAKDDVQDFANKIIYALQNPEYLNKLSNGAYEHMYLTWDEVVKSAYERYCYLIEQNQK